VALTREGFPPTLAGVIAFNEAHREEELRHFGQDHFVAAEERGPLTDPVYLEALAASQRSGQEGIDGLLTEHGLDALIAPTGNPAAPIDHVNGDRPGFGTSSPAARAGYPIVSVPAGFVAALPINLSFIGRRWSEETLIRLAYAFEQATHAWQPPRCLPTLPFD
jgi:amidase